MRKYLLLLMLPFLIGWHFHATKIEDFDSTSQLTNDTTNGAQIRANWYEGQDGWQTRGTYNDLYNVPIVDGETLYFHIENYVPTGFDSSSQGTTTIKKWMRIQMRTLNDWSAGLLSVMCVADSAKTSVRPYYDNEPVEQTEWRSTDVLPSCILNTWVDFDMTVKMKTDGTGWFSVTTGGVTRTFTNVDTYPEEGEDTARGIAPDDIVEYGVVYFLSYWNSNVNSDTYMYFKNIYLSNEMDWDTYDSGGEPSDTTAPNLSSRSPDSGSTVDLTPSISFNVSDASSGVNITSAGNNLSLDGVLQTGWTYTGTKSNYAISLEDVSISGFLTYNQVVTVGTKYYDNAGNANAESWDFTISDAPAVTTPVFSAGDTGTFDNYTPLTSSRWNVEDESGDAICKLTDTSYSPAAGGGLGEYALYNTVGTQYELNIQVKSPENLTTNAYADICFTVDHQSADDYIGIMLNSDPSSTVIFSYLNGVQTILDNYGTALITDNNFHEVTIRIENSALSVYWDDVLILSDNTHSYGSGKWGIGGYNDAAWFDDIVLTNLQPTPQESTPPCGRLFGTGKIKLNGNSTINFR